jgi:Zn ribbon nucleic-acid-binding protein
MDSILRNTGKVKLSAIDIEQLPNHKMKSAKEWSSACPQCGGEDRFLFWPVDGNFWCRQCELSGFVDQESQATLTDDQRADIEYRKRQARQAEIDRQRTALEQLQAKRNDLTYHRNLNGNSGFSGLAIVTLAPPAPTQTALQSPIIGVIASLTCAIVLALQTARGNTDQKPPGCLQPFSTPISSRGKIG